MKLGKMFKNVKRHLRAFKKYWLATERYPRFVIPMIFLIFAATSLTTTFCVMPLLSSATTSHTQTVYIAEDGEEEPNKPALTAGANAEKTEVKGTTETTEQDTVETPAQIEAATNPSAYRASARTTTTATTKTTTPVTTTTTPAATTTTTTTPTINIDQNRAAETPTDIVNPTPDDTPTDIPDEDML
ncbi:hypothetical protein IJG66_00010 [Candidatus Saccharibacteria bacterium]|nr:hypothetical protein [Candidatus Saccharibacteria bacterium]